MDKKRKYFLVSALFCLNMSLSAQSFLNISNTTLGKAMTELKQKGNYSFVFEKSDLNIDKKVTVKADNLKEALDQMFAGQGVNYSIQGKTTILQSNFCSISSRMSKHFRRNRI